MNVFWGILMIIIGLLLFICGSLKCQFVVYQLLVSRSKLLWGENVYRFHQLIVIFIIIAGVLTASGYTQWQT